MWPVASHLDFLQWHKQAHQHWLPHDHIGPHSEAGHLTTGWPQGHSTQLYPMLVCLLLQQRSCTGQWDATKRWTLKVKGIGLPTQKPDGKALCLQLPFCHLFGNWLGKFQKHMREQAFDVWPHCTKNLASKFSSTVANSKALLWKYVTNWLLVAWN